MDIFILALDIYKVWLINGKNDLPGFGILIIICTFRVLKQDLWKMNVIPTGWPGTSSD